MARDLKINLNFSDNSDTIDRYMMFTCICKYITVYDFNTIWGKGISILNGDIEFILSYKVINNKVNFRIENNIFNVYTELVISERYLKKIQTKLNKGVSIKCDL